MRSFFAIYLDPIFYDLRYMNAFLKQGKDLTQICKK